MFKVFFTFLLLGSLSTLKPSEEDLVGLWKASQYTQNGVTKDISSINITLQCSVEGRLGKFSGSTDKNFFSGLYDVKSKKGIEIQGFILTDFKDNEETTTFLNALKDANAFQRSENQLIFNNSQNKIDLVFTKM